MLSNSRYRSIASPMLNELNFLQSFARNVIHRIKASKGLSSALGNAYRLAQISHLSFFQILSVIICLGLAVAVKWLRGVPSRSSLSAIEPSELSSLSQIPPNHAVVCRTETSTIHLVHTRVLTVAERPTGVSTCICTVTGTLLQSDEPTLSPDGEVAFARRIY